MKKLLYVLLSLLAVIGLVYVLGPRPDYPEVEAEAVPAGLDAKAFAKTLHDAELDVAQLKPEARAEVVFAKADSSRTQTVFVYLHGFSASRNEGSPLVDEIGQRYKANIYWTRLSDHGLADEESFANANPHEWRAEGERFLKEAALLGQQIILIGTSTGATLALDLAARFPERVKALVLYSPNVALANPAASLLNGPWGLQLATQLTGSKYRELTDLPPDCAYIWTDRYRVEGIVALEELLELTMTQETFAAVEQPTMVAYYFKDEEHKDHIVSTEAIARMIEQLATPPTRLEVHPLSEVNGHVITTDCRSTGLDKVREVTTSFLEDVLGLRANPVAGVAVE